MHFVNSTVHLERKWDGQHVPLLSSQLVMLFTHETTAYLPRITLMRTCNFVFLFHQTIAIINTHDSTPPHPVHCSHRSSSTKINDALSQEQREMIHIAVAPGNLLFLDKDLERGLVTTGDVERSERDLIHL